MIDHQDLLAIWDEYLHDREFDRVLALADNYPDRRSLHILFRNLELFNADLAEELLLHPEEVLKAANESLRNLDLPIDVNLDESFVRVISLPSTVRMKARNLREYHAGRLVALEGMVRSASKAFTAITSLNVTCLRCGTTFNTSRPKAVDKLICINQACDRPGPFRRNIENSEKTAKRIIQLQENPEGLRGGELPEAIGVILTGDLVERISPGNRVVINGIVKLREIKSKAGETLDFENYLDAVSVEIVEREFEEVEISDEDEEQILELSQREDLIDQIRRSIAPSIYGMDDVKDAIALQLFSSPRISHQDGTHTRGDIHILLVGDPGIAKSQILRYVVNLAPRGVMTSGKSATSAGLTAAAVKDEMTDGRWTIEAGALPMADMGLAAIDEIEKMSDTDRDSLHEGLEQQVLSIAKAGITATLRCRCSVLAAANPKLGRFDQSEPIASQIKLMPTLLSRFDLIFVLFDIPSNEVDSAIAGHILNVDMDESASDPPILPDDLRKYIAYARRNVFPSLTPESASILKSYYLGVRNVYSEAPNQPVPTTARQLQGLIRLAKASARMRLREVVDEFDAQRAIALTDACLKMVGIDPETGKLDAGVIDIGQSKTRTDASLVILNIIKKLCEEGEGLAHLVDVIDIAGESGIDLNRAEKIIERLRTDGHIFQPRDGVCRPA